MIITKTPTRISFAGGSTDIKDFYSQHGSLVINAALAKYTYILVRPTPPIAQYKSQIQYRTTERVNSNSDIKHNGCRGVLNYLNIKFGVEVSNLLDLPSRSGLGSSSSYVVGLLNACHKLLNQNNITKSKLANESIIIERSPEHLNEAGGIQDQIASAYGGLNSIHISKDGAYKVRPLPICREFVQQLNQSLVLFYVGQRNSFKIAKSHNTPQAEKYKLRILDIAKEMLDAFSNENIGQIGHLTEASWKQKRQTSPLISNDHIDDLHDHMIYHNALGVRLLGSGSSGFMMCVTEDRHRLVKNIDLPNIEFSFDYDGSKIILS